MAQQLSTNTFGVAKWVVSPDPTQGTHTTITSALASASSGDTIWVRDGVYNESFTAVDGVTLQALTSSAGFSVQINGTLTGTGQNFVVNGFFFNTTGASCLSITGAGANVFYLYDCYLQNTGADNIVATNSNSASIVNLYRCYITADNSHACFTYSGASSLGGQYCVFDNAGSSVPCTLSGTSGYGFNYSIIGASFSLSTSSSGVFAFCHMANDVSTAPVVDIVSGNGYSFYGCFFNANNTSATSVFTCAGTCTMTMCSFDSTNSGASFLVNGAGTIFYAACSGFTGQLSTLIPVFNSTLTLHQLPIRLGNATNFTNIAFIDSPYTVSTDDQTILVDSSGGSVSLLFPDSPEVGQEWVVKDNSGDAGANNIILTTVSGTDMIDGMTSQAIGIGYGSATVVATSSSTYIIT